MSARYDVNAIIARYQAAYLQANGTVPPVLTYERGWFRFSGDQRPIRRVDIQEMTERLKARVRPTP